MIRSHNTISLSEHNGYFDRGSQESVPSEYHRLNRNSQFANKTARTRFGIHPKGFNVINDFPIRVHQYQKVGQSPHYIMMYGGGAPTFYDVDPTGTPTLILTLGNAATDFSMITLFDRAYITPHNGTNGFPGEFVYVYTGTGVARLAAGLAPVGPTFAAATGAVGGHVTKGRHLISVAYETDTGFITKPGPVIFYTAPGKRKINLTNIPVGPAYVSKRHILMTKRIQTYDGNPSHYELFFVPDGTINDNVTTTLTIDDLDSQLLDSADYLLDLAEVINAFLGFGTYQGSLVGFASSGEDSIARVSLTGQPESFDTTEGFILVSPGDGGGIRNTREYRGSLEFWKEHRTIATIANGDAPNTWPITTIDGGYGTGNPDGVTAVLDSKGDSKDTLLVCDDSGLLQFYGRYSDRPLSYVIDRIWRTYFGKNSAVTVDSIRKQLFVVSNDGTYGYVLMGDFNNGLDPDNIRWSLWTCQNLDTSNAPFLGVITTAEETIFHFFQKFDLFFLFDTSNFDQVGGEGQTGGEPLVPPWQYDQTPIYWQIIFPYIDDSDTVLLHFAGSRLRIIGNGTLNIRGYITDTQDFSIDRTLNLTPFADLVTLWNVTNERLSVGISCNAVNSYCSDLNDVVFFLKQMWSQRPA